MSAFDVHPLVRKLDGVGEKRESDPGDKIKTLPGAVCTTVWRIIFLVLIIINAIKLASGTKIIVAGQAAVYNIKPGVEGKQLDFPAMDWKMVNSITFYEANAIPSIQRFDFEDNNGYSKPYQTSGDLVPVERSVYQRFSVPINTFISQTAPIQAPRGTEASFTMNNIVEEAVNFKFEETLKIFYLQANVFEATSYLYNHTASLYVRFDSTQLARIKSCQLQVVMANEMEFEYLQSRNMLHDRTVQVPTNNIGIKTLVTEDKLWNRAGFDASDYTYVAPTNMLEYKKTFSSADMAGIKNRVGYSSNQNLVNKNDTAFLNWRVGINYVNNFVHTFNEYKCADKFLDNKLNLGLRTATPISQTATFLPVASCGGAVTTNCLTAAQRTTAQNFINNRGGFDMILTGWQGIERVRATALVTNGITITRDATNPINFAADFKVSDYESFSAPPTAPQDWTCTEDKFGAGDGCDCNCGAFDPDCLYQNPGEPTKGCPENEFCTFNRECASVRFSRFPGNGTYTTTMYISEPCSRIYKPGEMETTGFVGRESILATGTNVGNCPPCPGDTIYNGIPQRTENGRVVCNYAAQGVVNGLVDGPAWGAATGSITTNIRVGKAAGFPTSFSGFGSRISLTLSAGLPHQQQAELLSASPKANNGLQSITFEILGGGANSIDPLQHVARARVRSFFGTTSTYVVVQPINCQSFPVTGPYNVRSNNPEVSFQVAGVQNKQGGGGSCPNLQLISLTKQPTSINPVQFTNANGPPTSNDKGLKGKTTVKATMGAADKLRVRLQEFPLRSWTGLKFPVTALLWGTDNNFQSMELVTVTGATRNYNWTCPITQYNTGDGCHCNCGEYDPDCGEALLGQGGCPPTQACNVQGVCQTFADNTAVQTYRQNNQPPAERDSSIETLQLSEPVGTSHEAGVVVETFIQGTNNDSSLPIAYLSPVIKLSRTDTPYDPSQRYKQHTYEDFEAPERLDMEAAIFVTPDRKPLTANSPFLCPKLNSSGSVSGGIEGYTLWSLQNHTMELSDCKVTNPPPTDCVVQSQLPKGKFRAKCVRDMPPTAKMDWVQRIPINDVWTFDTAKASVTEKAQWVAGVQEPEVSFEVQDTFYFMFDPDAEEVNRRFAANVKTGGDTNQNDVTRYFSGALDYRSLGQGQPSDPNNDKTGIIPANPPYLKTQLHLELRSDAVKSAMDRAPTDWPTTKAGLETVFKNFKDTLVNFQFTNVGGDTESQTLPLTPGFLYTLEASVTITPLYQTDVVDSKTIDSWKTVITATRVTQTPLDYFRRSQTKVRWVLSLDDTVSQQKERYAYDFKNFVDGFGSALGMMGLAVVFVKLYQKFRPAPDAEPEKDQTEMDNLGGKENAAGEP